MIGSLSPCWGRFRASRFSRLDVSDDASFVYVFVRESGVRNG
jgi:hypothetical protein